MQLAAPVTLVVGGEELVLTQLSPVFIDDAGHQIVLVRLHSVLKPVVLWRNAEYLAVGDWTQAQADARTLELLGEDIQAGLQSLVFEYLA
jgi:hypothetical protein